MQPMHRVIVWRDNLLFSEKDRPQKGGGLFKKLLVLFNLLMLMNVLMINHVESLKNKKPQEVADFGGDKDDFVNQQERALTGIRSNSAKGLNAVESDLDRALLGFAADHHVLFGLLNTHRYTIWIVGLLLFIVVNRLFSRRSP